MNRFDRLVELGLYLHKHQMLIWGYCHLVIYFFGDSVIWGLWHFETWLIWDTSGRVAALAANIPF